MSPRLLQLGAEVLGWEWRPGSPWSSDPACGDHVHIPGYQTVSTHAYWLTAYMAEALMLHLRDRVFTQDAADIYMETIPAIHGYRCEWQEATSRIAAALVALGRITLDEAREMVG